MALSQTSLAQINEKSGVLFGTIQLDSTWNRTVYMSHVSEFSEMYRMSRSMIIAESDIDSTGHFEIKLNFLPEESNLYRLHVSKKNSGQVSIIIGGENENHFFLVANKNSFIEVGGNSNTFSDISIDNDKQNKILREIDNIVKLIDSTNNSSTKIKSDFVAKAFNEQLRQIADSCSYPLVSLYALEKSNYESNINDNLKYYQNFLAKWENQESVYFDEMRSRIPKGQNNKSSIALYFSGLLIAFGTGFIISKLFSPKLKKENLIQELSIQERKIFELLKKGKSNKEISEDLSIGISTVKSHVSSVLSKLKLKSRKDVLDFPN